MKPLKTLLASSLAGTIALVGGGLASVSAQQSTPAPSSISPVVSVHDGTCSNFTTEATYPIGFMEQIQVQSVIEEGGGAAETVEEFDAFTAYDDGLYSEDDEGYLSEDVDGDGIFEIGFDENDDGALDDNEILGEDADGDAVLTAQELWGPMPVQTVWKADVSDLGFDGAELVTEGQFVMVVRASDESNAQVLACGPVMDLVEEDFVIVPLQPYSNSGYYGTAMIQKEEGELAAYLFADLSVKTQGGTAAAATPATMDVVAIMGDDNVFTEEDEGYLYDNVDDDDLFEIGFDEDDDGALDDNEVLGEDDNEDSELSEDELDV